MPGKYVVGLDFGGTKIIAGVVESASGKLVGKAKKKTGPITLSDDIPKKLSQVVDEALEESGIDRKQLAGIGIGAAGMVNREKGVLLQAVNLSLNEIPLAEPLAQKYDVPVILGNDVEVATLGEMRFGSGRDCDNFVCVFIGTGIGSGIVINKQILRGATGTAGEIGHITLFPYGRPCGCGALGCLEAYASRTAIAKTIVTEINRGQETSVKDKIEPTKGILRSKAIVQATESGDKLVTRSVVEAAQFLGMGLASMINFLNPKRIILGGGIIEASELYFKIAQEETKLKSLKLASRKIEIVKATLGDHAGIIGAAQLVSRN